MTQPAELYACLYVRELPAQALLRLQPEKCNHPCVVLEGDPPAQFVCSLNTKARLLRLERGMTRVEVDTFPPSIILLRSRKIEAATKSILLECAAAFSPRVEDCSEDTVFLCAIDIAGTTNLFGSPETLAQKLLQRVHDLGITARVTISRNFHAALSLARGVSPSISLQFIPIGKEATTLASFPLTVLDLTETQAETFALWGIHTLGMLAALPEKELIARMGQEGKRLRQLALGQHPHFFQPVEPPFQLTEHLELDTPLEALDSLLFGISIMLEQLILRAQARILALATVTITLTLEGSSSHSRTVRPALPSNDKQLWIKLLHLDLEAHPPTAAILALTLHAVPGTTSKVQLGLFSPQLPEASRLDVTLARIRAIVGETAVGRAELLDTHALEAFRVTPFTVPTTNSITPASTQTRISMRILRPPETIAITLHDTRPAAFFFLNKRYTVKRAYGPWLTAGDWWNPSLWSFEQWDIIASTQDDILLCCCILRDPLRNQWLIAGLYD